MKHFWLALVVLIGSALAIGAAQHHRVPQGAGHIPLCCIVRGTGR